MLRVSVGDVDNIRTVRVFGRNPSITSGTAEDIWDGGGSVNFLSTAQVVYLSSTSVSDAGKTVLVEGLDANWDEVSESVTLHATDPTATAVATTTSFIRINKVSNNGTADYAGDIYVGETATITTGVPSGLVFGKITYDALINNNVSLNGFYSIPSGFYGFIAKWEAGVAKGDDMECALLVRENGKTFKVVKRHGVFQNSFQYDMDYIYVPEKADIKIRGVTPSTNMDVNAGFLLILVPTHKFTTADVN